MADNTKLNSAKKGKNDEFYTQLIDIERELTNYQDFFKDKIVYCNCDDPRKSNFFKYFVDNFDKLELQQLLCSCYNENGQGSYCIYNGDGIIEIKNLQGNGDFRSEECLSILKSADVVVTNPPFSLFREYVVQLINNEKKFLIIGHQNGIKYKETFPFIKENKMWLGFGFKGNVGFFINEHYEDYAQATQHQEGMIRVSGVMWFTNIEHDKRHVQLELYKKYNEEEYPKYDKFDGIEVSKTKEIPMDYKGIMGVPITFLCKYSPDQFEIVGELNHGCDNEYDLGKPELNGKYLYPRILIKHKIL